MTDVIEQLSAADPELGHARDPVKPPADLLTSIMDETDLVLPVPDAGMVPSSKRRRRPLVAAIAGFGAVLVVGAVTLLAINNTPTGSFDDVPSDPDTLITSEMILEDGVVTEEEYRAGAEALVICYTNAGIEAEVNFESNGHASFFFPRAGPPDFNANEGCSDLHLSQNVSLGWGAALGQIDLEELRAEDTAVTACVKESTGEEFGDLNYDQFGYLTEQGQQTKDAAFEYQDHQPWGRCRNDLGYEEKYKAETRALLECVEKGAGTDFGELDFDDTGHPTESSQLTLRGAIAYQDHQAWEACRTELGLPDWNITTQFD
jgi:hypothetical protein